MKLKLTSPLTQDEIDETISNLADEFGHEAADIRCAYDIAANVTAANKTARPLHYFECYVRDMLVESDIETKAAIDDEERRYGRRDWY